MKPAIDPDKKTKFQMLKGSAGSIVSRKITRNYIVALSLIAAMTVMGAVGLSKVIATQEKNAEVINIAGAQRMLSQRIAALSSELALETDDLNRQNILVLLVKSLERMRAGHDFLVNDSASHPAPSKKTEELSKQYERYPVELSRHVIEFQKLTQEFIDQGGVNKNAGKIISDTAISKLLPDLDGAVKLYQQAAESEIENAAIVHKLVTAIALLLLMLEAFLIFRPMARTVGNQADDLEKRATTDRLTGLLNREAFQKNVSGLLDANDNVENCVAAISIDLDWFKEVNDTEGHDAGDEVLRVVSQRLLNIVGHNQIVARLGGDEFAVVLQQKRSSLSVWQLADQIRVSFADPIIYNSKNLRVGATIGIAMFPEHGQTFDELLHAADYALREAKRNGKGSVKPFLTAQRHVVVREKTILQSLDQQTAFEHLYIAFQPQVLVKDTTVIGCEALVRWNHPVLGPLSPIEFLPIATAYGHSKLIGSIIQTRALEDFVALRDQGIVIPRLAINLSNGELGAFDCDVFTKQLATFNLSPNDIEIEITEDVLLDRISGKARDQLSAIRAAGTTIALDDFGTGFASLSHLRRFEVDVIKIDTSLISTITSDARSLQIVSAIIGLSHGLSAKVVAEGVENDAQFTILRDLKCDIIQGFMTGKPMNKTDFSHWWNTNNLNKNQQKYPFLKVV